MHGLSQEERERWINALGGRILWHVEMLVGFDPATEIESDVDATSNGERPESAHGHDTPDVSGPAPPRTNPESEEKH
jgi:hypothetical protein